MGVPFALISLLLIGRRSAVRSAAVAFGLVAAAGVIASAAGFAFDTYASGGKWVELANELAFILVGVVVIARGSSGARGIAGGALGLLGVVAATVNLPVFRHGVVLSTLPSTVARVIVALTIWSGATATALGLIVYERVLSSEPPDADSAIRYQG